MELENKKAELIAVVDICKDWYSWQKPLIEHANITRQYLLDMSKGSKPKTDSRFALKTMQKVIDAGRKFIEEKERTNALKKKHLNDLMIQIVNNR